MLEMIREICNMMTNAMSDLMSAIISISIGVDIDSIKKVFEKTKLEKSETTEISASIDVVRIKLEESKGIIDNALREMDKQRQLYEQMKTEAEISQQISSMNEEQVKALGILLEKTLNTQEKKSFPKNFLWNLFFCILSAVVGYALGKVF